MVLLLQAQLYADLDSIMGRNRLAFHLHPSPSDDRLVHFFGMKGSEKIEDTWSYLELGTPSDLLRLQPPAYPMSTCPVKRGYRDVVTNYHRTSPYRSRTIKSSPRVQRVPR